MLEQVVSDIVIDNDDLPAQGYCYLSDVNSTIKSKIVLDQWKWHDGIYKVWDKRFTFHGYLQVFGKDEIVRNMRYSLTWCDISRENCTMEEDPTIRFHEPN